MSMISAAMGIIGAMFLFLGVLVFICEIFGIIRYKYVLNRMHAAGMGDTLGLFLSLLGLIFINGINFTTLKFALVILFVWLTSPTSSHLIAGLVSLTDEEIEKHVRVDVDDLKSHVDVDIDETTINDDAKEDE